MIVKSWCQGHVWTLTYLVIVAVLELILIVMAVL